MFEFSFFKNRKNQKPSASSSNEKVTDLEDSKVSTKVCGLQV